MYAGDCAPCCVVGRDRRAYRLAASVAIDRAPRPVSLQGGHPLLASPDDVECVHQRAGAIRNGEPKDALQILFSLRLDGASPDQLPGLVLVTAQSNLGPSSSDRGGVGERRVSALLLEPDDYGRTHIVTVSIDRNNEGARNRRGQQSAHGHSRASGAAGTVAVAPLPSPPRVTAAERNGRSRPGRALAASTRGTPTTRTHVLERIQPG
jgi:hypothetical protein